MTTFQKWLDRIDNLLEVQKFSGEDTISASFTRRELIELKMMIGVASENGEEWNGFNKSVIAPKGTFEKIWEAEEEQEQKMGHCKECKYFEYDSLAMVDGIPLIVAHEICSKWGGGCKTNEDGYCFLYEPQESEETE